ncbi:universal stress protein [Arcanobacterium phocae]|uniref:universal stress protein n=1 Tax=Arcanobacterium phocae TaxID=131112 RepID=UPI001C0F9D77|nr:universal stress protein [Arcanobacterium phocae]
MSIVVPVGRGDRFNPILRRGITLAQNHDTSLVVLFSCVLDECSQDEIDTNVDLITDKLEQVDIAFDIVTRLDGVDLATQIRETALAHDASLIIISLAPKPSHGSYQLGSQIQKLLVDAPCELLIMRDAVSE